MKDLLEKNKELKASSWPSFFMSISDELKIVEENLSEKMAAKSKLLSEIIKYIFNAGGKRIRPALCFLIAKGTGGVKEKHITQAELTELIHTASLVHDDIIDSATLRRGKETVNNVWNSKISVISGDYLFAEASIRLGILENTDIVKIYAKVLGDLCDGEIDQFAFKYNTEISWDYYIGKSTTKTASLFAAACKSAAIINNKSQDIIDKAEAYGKNLGIAFQVVDDILDFTSSDEVFGKDVGNDLKSGLITAPTLYALNANNEKSNKLKKLIESRFTENEGSFAEAINLIKELDGCSQATKLAKDYVQKAKSQLDFIESAEIRTDLEKTADYMLNRLN